MQQTFMVILSSCIK